MEHGGSQNKFLLKLFPIFEFRLNTVVSLKVHMIQFHSIEWLPFKSLVRFFLMNFSLLEKESQNDRR